MTVLANIPFTLDADALRAQARVDPDSDDAADLRALAARAQRIGRPKAVYTEAFVTGRDGHRIQLERRWFHSRTLAHHLRTVERVFPLLATCGSEMDAAAPDPGDMLKAYWWDLIKAHLLDAANRALLDHLRRTFRLGQTASMHPGSGDADTWPIDQQRPLFDLLGDVESAVGVRLTESFLMVPNKTTSGILFSTASDFRSCQVCHRTVCPSRRAPFDAALWDRIQAEHPAERP